MQYFMGAAALAASASLVLGAPAHIVRRDTTFSIDLVAAGQVYKSGPLHAAKTYGKYAKVGAVMPEDVSIAASKAAGNQSGTVAANPQQYDQAYLSPVSVGGQTLNLDFDTGSADLWVFSTLLPSSSSTGHSTYNPKSGKKITGASWNITYGDGSGAAGTVYTDKVVVGNVTATSQAVEAATSISSTFQQDTDNDGLLGLAFSTINTVQPKQQTTFFDTVAPTLKSKLFAADLQAGKPGSYQFGYIDSSKYTGSITYVPVDSTQGFWGFTAGDSIGAAIADTGTSLLYLPDETVSTYYGKTSATYDSNQGGYTFDCTATLPDFTVTIGSATFTVPGKYINYAPVDDSGATCFGGIQSNSGIGFTIFGDIFLKAVYVVFDKTTTKPRLGFASQPSSAIDTADDEDSGDF